MASPICQNCKTAMRKKTQSSGNMLGLAIALIVLTIGIILCFTVVGMIVGIPLIIVSLFIGGKKTKIWMCPNCRIALPRA